MKTIKNVIEKYEDIKYAYDVIIEAAENNPDDVLIEYFSIYKSYFP